MKVCIFTECHKSTGRGHLTRCLSITEEFRSRNIEPLLYVDNNGNESICQVDNKIIPLNWLSDIEVFKNKIIDADIVVIDSYLANEKYYHQSSLIVKIPVFFDDYSRLQYPEGIIVNGSPGVDEKLYTSYNNKNILLTGSLYQIVKAEFHKEITRFYNELIENILITIGGKSNPVLVGTIITTAKKNLPNATLHVVSCDVKTEKNVKVYSRISSLEMNRLMRLCDLAITGAGQTIFELMITGTPFIALQIIDNQKYNIIGLSQMDKNIVINEIDNNLEANLLESINYLIPLKNRINQVEKFHNLMDSNGAKRIVKEILKQGMASWFTLRKATVNDLIAVYNLSSEPEVRKNSFVTEEISLKKHTEWFNKTIKDKSILFIIAEIKDVFAGQIRYRINKNECTVGISVCSHFRGLSIGEKLLIESIPILKNQFPNVNLINAWVKPENEGSNKLFLRAGYQLVLEKDSNNHNAKKYRLNI